MREHDALSLIEPETIVFVLKIDNAVKACQTVHVSDSVGVGTHILSIRNTVQLPNRFNPLYPSRRPRSSGIDKKKTMLGTLNFIHLMRKNTCFYGLNTLTLSGYTQEKDVKT